MEIVRKHLYCRLYTIARTTSTTFPDNRGTLGKKLYTPVCPVLTETVAPAPLPPLLLLALALVVRGVRVPPRYFPGDVSNW
jgi:hypothetical protein